MKICYVSCSAIFGGVENIIIKTLNALCLKHEVALVVPKGCEYTYKLNCQIKVYEYKSFDKRYNPFLYLEIYKIVSKYDLIHTHGAKASQIFYIINKFINKKFVATKHNIRKGKIFNKIQNVISVSREVANTIEQKSKVLYFGIEKVDIQPKKLTEKFSIVAIGRLDYIKGFDELIKAVSKLNFDFRLFIIGRGKEENNLKQLITDLELNDKVTILGFRTDILEILKGANLQVISSRSEGLPNTLIEGIFYSNVLIATRVGGISEVLNSKFLFSPNKEDCAKKIIEVKENYDKFNKEFALFVNNERHKFSFSSYLNNLLNYYENLK